MTKLELAICETENNSEIGNKNDQKSTVHKSYAIFTVLRYQFRRQ